MARTPLDYFKKGAFSRQTWIRAASGAALAVAGFMGAGLAANHSERIEDFIKAHFTQAATDIPAEDPAAPPITNRQNPFITGGYKYALPPAFTGADGRVIQPPPRTIDYYPATTISGCLAENQPVRLSFQMGIIDDSAPSQDEGAETQNRVAQLSWIVADLWKAALTNGQISAFDLHDETQAAAMRDFLDYASLHIYQETGVRTAFKINRDRGVQFGPGARADEYSTCRPAGEAPIPAPRDIGPGGTPKAPPLPQ